MLKFKEQVFELAFGDDAINKGFSEKEVLEKLREFSNDALKFESVTNEPIFTLVVDGESQHDDGLGFMDLEEAREVAEEYAGQGNEDIRIVKAVFDEHLEAVDYEQIEVIK